MSENNFIGHNRVYLGTWNPISGAYPLHNGRGAVWDVVLNDGVESMMFDGVVWGGGQRLGYVPSENKYYPIQNTTGVYSVNGKNGAVILHYDDVGAVPRTRKVNNKELSADINLVAEDVGAYTKAEIDAKDAQFVSMTRNINGKPLSADVTLEAADVGTYSKVEIDNKDANLVPLTRKINGKSLTSDVSLVAADVGAVPVARKVNGKALDKDIELTAADVDSYSRADIDAKDAQRVPVSRKVNGKDLSTDITISADELGASTGELPLPDVWAPLNNDLKMITGYGREVKVGEEVIANMVNFERSTTATYIDKSGVLRTAGINEPRFEKEGLLIEGQSTNLCHQSSFDNSATGLADLKWVAPLGKMNIAEAEEVTLDGVSKAKVLEVTAETGSYQSAYYRSLVSSTAPTVYTASVAVKPGTTDKVSLLVASAPDGKVGARTVIDIGSGKVISSNNVGSGVNKGVSIKPLSDGWFLVALTVEVAEASCLTMFIYPNEYSNQSQGDNIKLSHVQLEALPFATSYIPTDGAAVTRAADKCWLPWAGNMTTGDHTVAMVGDYKEPLKFAGFCGAGKDGQEFWVRGTSGNNVNYRGGDKITPAINHANGKSLVVGGRISGSLVSGFCDGEIKSHPSEYTNPRTTCPIYAIGGYASGLNINNPLFGHIRNFRIWHKALTDNQMRSIA